MLYQRGRAYSQDLRERVFAASDDGERVGEIAELFRVTVGYVSKALTRRRTTGETTVRAQHGHKLPKLAPFYAAIRAYVAERGDVTITELRTWSVGLVWHTLKMLTLSLKKKPLRAAEQDRPDVAKARAEWRENQPTLDAGRLIHSADTARHARRAMTVRPQRADG
jgi:transposase